MKHTLEEEEKICTLCNFTVVVDGINLPNIHMQGKYKMEKNISEQCGKT